MEMKSILIKLNLSWNIILDRGYYRSGWNDGDKVYIDDGDGNGCDGSRDGVFVIMMVIILVLVLEMVTVVDPSQGEVADSMQCMLDQLVV